jgi:hypothetical protein
LLVLGFRIGLKVQNPGHMEFLLGHMASARMAAKTLLLNWDVHVDVMQGVTMDKLLDRVLAFEKDPDSKFWLTHYPYVLLGRRASDGRQRLPILGSYAELAEVYKRAFQLLAVLHGDRMFGETQHALFLDWMKAFFDKAALNLMQTFRTFNDKVFVYLGQSIQQVGARFLMDISRASPMIVMEPFFNVHGSEIPKDAAGKVFHIFLVDRFSMCHQIYSSGMVGHEDCGRGYWGIDPNVGAPTVKNQWNSVMVNPDFMTRLPSPLFEQHVAGGVQRGNERQSIDPYLPGSSADQAPVSPVKQPQAPKRGAAPAATPPVVIDMTDEKQKRGPPPHHWDGEEKKAVEEFLKVNYGLNGKAEGNTGGFMCHLDIKAILYPGYFYECNRTNPPCTFRHGLTATEAEGAYLDGSEAQKDAIRALTPSFTAAIAGGTLKKSKVPKKKGK